MSLSIHMDNGAGKGKIDVYSEASSQIGQGTEWTKKYFQKWLAEKEKLGESVKCLRNPPTLYSEQDLINFFRFTEIKEKEEMEEKEKKQKKKRGWIF